MCVVMGYGVPSPLVLLGSPGLIHEPVPTGFHVLVLVEHLLRSIAFVLTPDRVPGHTAVAPHMLHLTQSEWLFTPVASSYPLLSQISQRCCEKRCEVSASSGEPSEQDVCTVRWESRSRS